MRRTERPARDPGRRRLALRLCAAWGDTADARRRVATVYGLTERTLRRWAQRLREGRPLAKPRGRPPTPVARSLRQDLIAALRRLGPFAGVPALRGMFRTIPYRVIASMKRRYARAIQRRRGWHRRKLLWKVPGAVWATDFTHPPARLSGGNNRLCLVRDLASGMQLAAVPCRGERANVACRVLAALFLVFGVPLLVKHDRGGAFTAHATQRELGDRAVVALLSPPRTPPYNGSSERAGGNTKVRAAHAADLHGRPHRCTDDDLAEALLLANATARPWGANGPTPMEAFDARQPISRRARKAFKRTRARAIARALKTWNTKHGTMPSCSERAAIVRRATQHALCTHGYLAIRRGRISTPILTWKADAKA